MGKGTTRVDIPSARAAAETLKSEAPQENELSNIFTQTANELAPISDQHDGFLGDSIAQIEAGGDIYSTFSQINDDFNKYIENVNAAVAKLQAAEQNGRVENDGAGITEETGTVPSSNTPSNNTPQGETPEQPTTSTPEGSNVPTNPTDPESTPEGTNPTTQTVTVGGNPTDTPEGTAAAAAGAVAGTAIAGSEMGGQGSPDETPTDPVHDNNPFGSHPISSEAIDSLTPEEREALKRKLHELGFSDEEIEQIMGGEGSVPSVQVDATAQALEEALKRDPSLRDKLIAQYGFDIFNPDGTVNKDRLALALMMDNKNGNDNYSLFEYLRTQYGINIVNPTDLTNLAARLEALLSKYPDLRAKLIAKYGFDIFNADGTVNKDKLALAMLMDAQNGSDDFDLLAFLTTNYGEEGLSAMLGDVKKPVKAELEKKSGVGVVPIAAGLGVLGAIGGGTALLLKKKKDDEDEEENEFDDELREDPTAVIEENNKQIQEVHETPAKKGKQKEWLHGIGLGAQQTPDGKVIGTSANERADLDEDRYDSEYIHLEKVKPEKASGEGKINLMPFLAAGIAAGTAGKIAKDHMDDDSSDEEKEGE